MNWRSVELVQRNCIFVYHPNGIFPLHKFKNKTTNNKIINYPVIARNIYYMKVTDSWVGSFFYSTNTKQRVLTQCSICISRKHMVCTAWKCEFLKASMVGLKQPTIWNASHDHSSQGKVWLSKSLKKYTRIYKGLLRPKGHPSTN